MGHPVDESLHRKLRGELESLESRDESHPAPHCGSSVAPSTRSACVIPESVCGGGLLIPDWVSKLATATCQIRCAITRPSAPAVCLSGGVCRAAFLSQGPSATTGKCLLANALRDCLRSGFVELDRTRLA